MNGITKARFSIVKNSQAAVCSICGCYVGDHGDLGCCACGCEVKFRELSNDINSGDGKLYGYIKEFSNDTKVAIRIGDSVKVFGIPEAEELANFIYAVCDIGKMTAIESTEKNMPNSNICETIKHIFIDGVCSRCGTPTIEKLKQISAEFERDNHENQ